MRKKLLLQTSKACLALLFCFLSIGVSLAQNRTISGTVTDTQNQPVIGAAVMMSVTRQTLATKVRANTGLSTLEYIRICRLKKAAELLAERKYRISEVAYLVGYTSPSYFTKHFQQQFGMTPSEFIHSND